MGDLKQHKVVSALPNPLEADSVYYVRAGLGFDLYVTNANGALVAYALNAPALRDAPLLLRQPGDLAHQLAFKDVWDGVGINGPMFIGYNGGGLGTTVGGTGEKLALFWNSAGVDVRGTLTRWGTAVMVAGDAPTAHAASHAQGAPDALTPGSIGAATATHTHANATTTVAGFLTGTDKLKLDSYKGNLRSNIVAQVSGGTSSTTDVVFTSLSVPANTLSAGDRIEVRGFGTTSNGTVANTVSFWVRVGGTKITLLSQAMGTTAASGVGWEIDAVVTARTIGASGTLAVNGTVTWKGVPSVAGQAQSTAKSTAATVLVEVGATMSVSDASSNVIAQQASIVLL